MEQLSKHQKMDALFELVASITDPNDCKALFQDLCTAKEIENMAERVYAARLLMEGKTYTQIMEVADISSATLSRVSRCVRYGEGYNKFLK